MKTWFPNFRLFGFFGLFVFRLFGFSFNYKLKKSEKSVNFVNRENPTFIGVRGNSFDCLMLNNLGVVKWDQFDPTNRLIPLSVIPLSGVHLIYKMLYFMISINKKTRFKWPSFKYVWYMLFFVQIVQIVFTWIFSIDWVWEGVIHQLKKK